MSNSSPIWISVLAGISTIVGTYLGVTTQFVSKPQFDEFKTGIIGRLDRIENKLDKIADKSH